MLTNAKYKHINMAFHACFAECFRLYGAATHPEKCGFFETIIAFGPKLVMKYNTIKLSKIKQTQPPSVVKVSLLDNRIQITKWTLQLQLEECRPFPLKLSWQPLPRF